MNHIDFVNRFEVISNPASGNCLFESVSYLFNGLLRDNEPMMSQEDVRVLIWSFYRNFRRSINYDEGTIESSILLGLLFDNDDEGDDGEIKKHDDNVANDKVWGSMIDLLVCSLVFNVDICLYKKSHINGSIDVEYIKNQRKNKKNKPRQTINILFTGSNHFEALKIKG